MVHGNVGQSDLTREDMARYIRYLVDVIGAEQKALYSYLEDHTNPYICLHGECQTLANWISVLLEAYGESFTRWDMRLHFTVFGKRYSDLNEQEKLETSEQFRLIDAGGLRNVKEFGAYLHTVIEWDGLYWDANGGGTKRDKEEYYEDMIYLSDGKQDRKRLLYNFIDWVEFEQYLERPNRGDDLDYEWEWVDLSTGIQYTVADEMMMDWMNNFDSSNPPRDNLGVFREFINHLRMDDFAAERIYFDDEYGGFIKGNPRAKELPGEVLFPGEEERLAKIMSPEEYAELEQEVNLILSKNLPYNVESLSEDERIALHEDIIMKILNHEYIHQSIDDEVLEWAIENNKTKGDYYAAHEIMAYVDMALRESLGMRDFKLQLTSLVSQHPILTDNPELGDRIMDALTRTRKGQRFQIPTEIETLMRAFYAEDYEILVVGGAVRDMLMGLVPKDYDLATNATPEEVEAVVSKLDGYRTVTTPEAQMARGVLTTLVLPPSGEVIEVTTFRAELGYEDGTRRPVAVAADTFYEDSLRRDFTMNALGWRLNGTILDYHEGVDDIEFGQLVAVGDASERLEEDPLRILRAVRFASRYGLEIDEELGAAIETNLPQLLTLSPERIRRELDTILKSEEGVYDLFETGILETIIPEYKGIYWGERHYDELPVITSVRSYGQIDRELSAYEQGLGWKSEPWQPALAYALLLQGRLTREDFNEQYRRGPISFSKAEADMIAELIELYPVALESEEPADIVAVVTSPYYAELMLMLEYTNRSDLVDYFKPYRSRYKGKPPKGYAMTVADEYGIEPGPALGERLSEITEALILGDIEDWDEGLNYYAAEEVGTRERIAYAGVILDEDTSEQLLAHFETLIPESWTRYAHHMTVSLGKSIPNQADLGTEVTLTVTAVGKSDDAIAVAVSGYPSRNAIPHITLAVPPGGKPFNSNKITDWHSVEPFAITGQLQDVKTYVAEEIDTLHESLNYPRGFYSKRERRHGRSRVRQASKDWTDWFDEVWDDFAWKAESFKAESGPTYLYGSYYYDHSLQDLYENFEMYWGDDDKYGILNASPDHERGIGGSGRWAVINAFNTGVLREVPIPKRDWITNFFGEITPREMNYILRNWDNLAFNFGLDQELDYEEVYEDGKISEYAWPKNGLKGLLWSRHDDIPWRSEEDELQGNHMISPEQYYGGIRRMEFGPEFYHTLNYPYYESETVTKYAESFWGDAGSGVLVVARDTQRILLGLRSEDVNEPNTWGNFGGAIGVTDSGEPEEALPPEENALKEMAEEIGYTGAIEMIPSFTYRSPEFTFYNFIGLVDRESDIPLNQFNWEVSELRWFTLDEVMALPNLHFGVSALMRQEELVTLTAESKETIKLYTGEVVPVTYDASGQPYVTLYHATTMDNFEIIEATGLKPFTPGYYEKLDFETYDNVEGIYFATDLEQAQKWIGWKYRETICIDIEYLEEEGYEVSLVPNEIAGVVYAVDFPLIVADNLGDLEGVTPDSEVPNAWYATEAISRLEMNVVGFYSVPICLYGRRIEPSEIKELSEFEAKQIHERGFYVDAIPSQDYFMDSKPPSSEFLVKYPHIASPFTVARRKGRRYLPLYHILSPRDSFFSGYRGTFMAESVPMSDWSKLSPVELVELSQFPSGDGHMDGWDMYLPQDWPHWDVLEQVDDEYYDMERKYAKDNNIRYLSWKDRKNLPYTMAEIYAKYFDFWYVPAVANSMSGGGYGQIYDSLKEAYAPDTWERESEKRGLPFNEYISLEEAAKYFSPQEIEWAREAGRDTMFVYKQPVVDAYINEHLALGREGVFYSPVLAAAPVDAEVGTDASREARLLDGWHRDAYANLLYDQDPSQGGAPTVFFKPKEEYL